MEILDQANDEGPEDVQRELCDVDVISDCAGLHLGDLS
jgi:hypothetical protein